MFFGESWQIQIMSLYSVVTANINYLDVQFSFFSLCVWKWLRHPDNKSRHSEIKNVLATKTNI